MEDLLIGWIAGCAFAATVMSICVWFIAIRKAQHTERAPLRRAEEQLSWPKSRG
jgi:hypothetical protein